MLQSFPKLLFRAPLYPLRYAYNSDAALQNTLFHEGLYLASPELYAEYIKQTAKGAADEKMQLSIAKYSLRSATRCTPYGTFAGSALAAKGDNTSIVLAPAQQHTRKLRIDMNYMAAIVETIIALPVVRDQIVFYPNNSIYTAAGALRYAEYFVAANTRHYQLTAVPLSDYVAEAIRLAKTGITLPQLAAHLAVQAQVPEAEARDFAEDLWRSQLLIPSLDPCVTGAEPLLQVIASLSRLTGMEVMVQGLQEIADLIAAPREGIAYYQQIEDLLGKLDLAGNVPKNTLQVDLFLEADTAVVDTNILDKLVQQVAELKSLARPVRNGDLEDFKKKFQARYEGEQVPLALVLDADLGIGYAGIDDRNAGGHEWMKGLALAYGSAQGQVPAMDYIQEYAVKKYQDWLKQGKPYITLEAEELQAFREHTGKYTFPGSMYLMGCMFRQDGQLDADHFLFDVTAFGGPSAGNLLGRFTHGNDALCTLTRAILAKEEEENPEAIYAEIAHLPQARVGNVLLRPVLRQYEIPYVGLSGADRDKQITIDDLWVSVIDNEIVLWSRRLNRRVIPRLTTAHNFGFNSLPVYKFLCDLQGQGMAYPNVWDWGHAGIAQHLPRVVYKNLVLRKASWRLGEADIKELPQAKEAQMDFFRKLRETLQLPQRVVLTEGDNELLIDFEEQMGLELLLHYLKKYKNLKLDEFLFTEENCVVRDAAGNGFTNQMLLPLYEAAEQPAAIALPKEPGQQQQTEAAVQRTFSPYSEWLYFKVYCGAKSAEKLLATTLHDFIERGITQGLFERFFFIRYHDEGGSHFRIRFYNSAIPRQTAVYAALMQVLQPQLDAGNIENVVLDSYKRELERYLPGCMVAAEQLFYHDSLAVLRFLHLLQEIEEPDKYRVLFALRGIDMLLDDFGLDMPAKSALLKNMQSSFFREFGGQIVLQQQLNARYREQRKLITSHMDAAHDESNGISEAVAIFETRSTGIREFAGFIKTQLQEEDRPQALFNLLPSYIHMYVNRLFIAQQRKFELVLYHFLEKHYGSQLALQKKQPL